jgi:hypothetical protein
MKANSLFYIILFLGFILLLKNETVDLNALIVENNPFYGLSNDEINSIESTTDDNLIKVKLEYAPAALQIGSPEFFKVTLFYRDSSQIALHADTDIVILKDGKELYKASNEFSQPFVHTPNGIVLSSYKFPDSGQYIITVKILGLNFMPVSEKQANFAANVTDSNDKYTVKIGT